MDWNQIWRIIGAVVAAVGGIGVIIIGLSSWLGKIIANRVTEKYRFTREEELRRLEQSLSFQHESKLAALQHEYDRQLETERQRLSHEIEMLHSYKALYAEKLFETHIELWAKLLDLKVAADNIWETASSENLLELGRAMKETRLAIQKAGLLLDEDRFEQLNIIIRSFDDLWVGKTRLIDLRTKTSLNVAIESSGETETRALERIRRQIEHNRMHYQDIANLIENLRRELNHTITGDPMRARVDALLNHYQHQMRGTRNYRY